MKKLGLIVMVLVLVLSIAIVSEARTKKKVYWFMVPQCRPAFWEPNESHWCNVHLAIETGDAEQIQFEFVSRERYWPFRPKSKSKGEQFAQVEPFMIYNITTAFDLELRGSGLIELTIYWEHDPSIETKPRVGGIFITDPSREALTIEDLNARQLIQFGPLVRKE